MIFWPIMWGFFDRFFDLFTGVFVCGLIYRSREMHERCLFFSEMDRSINFLGCVYVVIFDEDGDGFHLLMYFLFVEGIWVFIKEEERGRVQGVCGKRNTNTNIYSWDHIFIKTKMCRSASDIHETINLGKGRLKMRVF